MEILNEIKYLVPHEFRGTLNSTILEPKDYCNFWIPIKYKILPNERGYHSACVEELAKVTGARTPTVVNWHSDFSYRPAWVPRILAYAHALQLIQEKLNKT